MDKFQIEQINTLIDKRLAFNQRKIGDTPLGAYELVNKLYADTGGTPDLITYASTITLDTSKGRLHTFTTTAAVGNATINASTGGTAGQILQILITNDATANRTITFGTNFKPNATLIGTTSKSAVVTFVSNSTSLFEVSRQTGL